MNGLITLSLFFTYFAGFLFSAFLRFYFYIYRENHSVVLQLILIVLAGLSGFSCAISLSRMKLVKAGIRKNFLLGSSLGIASFFALYGVEDFLSKQRLAQSNDPQIFSQMKGHCGVYIGREIIHWYHQNTEPFLQNHVKDYQMSNQCRIRHFLQMQKMNLIACDPHLDGVQCQLSWMDIFADKGNWNLDARTLFLNRILEAGNGESPGEQKPTSVSFSEYAIKDHELASANPSEMKQAGVEEQFSDEYLYQKQREDVRNLELTAKIFSAVSKLVGQTDENAPAVLRYREVERESQIQLEKLPELKRDLAELSQRTHHPLEE